MALSLCMIVKDEAALLPRCLSSLQGLVDEMIVVDTGSTDGTIAIAQQFGAQVHAFPWQDDFALARNESLQYARGEWILVLDADEVLVPEMIPVLRQSLTHDRTLLINLVRQEVGAKQSPYSLVSRLFRNRPDLRFSRPYHETVDDSVLAIVQAEPGWQIADLAQVAILHDGYQEQAIASRDKVNRAQRILEKALIKQPHDAYLCSKLGALYLESGTPQRGLKLLQRGLASAVEPPLLYELYYHLGIAWSQLKDAVQAEVHYRLALQQPILAILTLGARINLGNLLLERGATDEARKTYESVIAIDPNLAIAHYNLGLTLKALGQFPAAIAAYRETIRLQPDYAEAHQNLGVALLKTGNIPESLVAFQQAITLHEQQHSPEADRLRQGLAGMGFRL
ncbi:glycosyltransferase [Leptolyngbya sp. 'hensonii']|nr:glycosyltransferase [Leptolyngbya sp. 'hensonii']